MKKNKKKNPETLAEEDLKKDLLKEETEIEDSVEEDNIEEEFDALQTENQKLKEDYLRAFAELENTKKRCAQEIEKNNKYAISSFAKNLLSVADNLHRAIDAVGKEQAPETCAALLEGVKLTEAELMKVFGKFGIQKMDILGKVFDPNFHQVIQEVEDPSKPSGTVIAELQTGYMLNDRLLREAMVVVTKGGPSEK